MSKPEVPGEKDRTTVAMAMRLLGKKTPIAASVAALSPAYRAQMDGVSFSVFWLRALGNPQIETLISAFGGFAPPQTAEQFTVDAALAAVLLAAVDQNAVATFSFTEDEATLWYNQLHFAVIMEWARRQGGVLCDGTSVFDEDKTWEKTDRFEALAAEVEAKVQQEWAMRLYNSGADDTIH